MTDRQSGVSFSAPRDKAQAADALLANALRRAWWSLAWEGLWPRLAVPVAVVGLFLTASWAGLWYALPPVWRAVGVCGFGFVLLASLVPLVRWRRPGHAEALRRLDLGSGVPHRPATAISDEVAVGRYDPASVALWQAHLDRALRFAQNLRAGFPRPRLSSRDPYAIRALILLLAVVTFMAAGGERTRRIMAAFDWRGVVTPANFRIDAWATPPLYTNKAPIILPGIRSGERTARVTPAQQALPVPAGTVLVVRAAGAPLDVETSGGLAPAAEQATARLPDGSEERRFTISDHGQATLRVGSESITWSFSAVPDRSPTIALVKDPEPQARGSLLLVYEMDDDYGVIAAEAQLALKAGQSSSDKAARPLYGAPNFPLVLPQSRTRKGAGQTTRDLSEHPWAGVDVTLTLVARDEAGNEGRSEPRTFLLPQRPFYKPLAKALVEQRRVLALDAESRKRVLTALDALTIAPERFTPEASIYLGLRSIRWNLANAKTDDQLREVVDRLWKMALNIEDGNIGDAEQALRAAQEALRQALERGATDEELKRLMDQLRAALDKFMQALAEEMRRNPQQLARPLDPNARELSPRDLKSMLDRLEQLARSGAKDAARQMLEQLQSMLENLQMARPGQQGDQGDDMMSALDELGDMVRRERELRDRTFRQGQDSRRERQRNQRGQQGQRGQRGQQGQQGQQGEQGEQGEGQQGFNELRRDQQALREQLRKLLDELRKRGQGQGQQGQGQGGQDPSDALGRAEQAMRDAEGALGEGDGEGAVDSQGRAIEALRQGAQSLAQQMQQGDGPFGPGPNGQPGRTGPARAQQDTDPLGRPLRGRDYGDDTTVKVPGEIDVQRARRILEELRRRFSDPARPQLELDYIERLLRNF
jgi:uncharacterized protein (TIGR02302 family)